MRVRLLSKPKPNNYTESCMINEADRWRGRNVWYPGRSVRYALKGVTIAQSNAERTEVSRGHSSREAKDRISRSLEYDRERRNDRLWQKTLKTMAVRKEIVRNTKGMQKRQGHSIGYGKKETVHSQDFWKRYCIKTTLTERIRESRQTRERQELMA